MFPPGGSPSSSASDVDNLNHPTAADKIAFPKGVSSPQVAGNRPNFVRLLNFAQDVNYAMEASRKSRVAFAHAKSSLSRNENEEVIYSVKKALDWPLKKEKLVDKHNLIVGGIFPFDGLSLVMLWNELCSCINREAA
ncbi:cysteine-tryptophan domain-containing zinc finger protein 3-like [Hibiscus syriacus]|uniref:cysteine-tryptophan domain-containing zinc finger protein 3-like n=1 Tax=Hibiscus syriacus TaxID=106335 RepID=UPI00192300BA|nr:cysteine-tryptophan domain-containing zinc finger protein 3-like [Hibiscus syriacus]